MFRQNRLRESSHGEGKSEPEVNQEDQDMLVVGEEEKEIPLVDDKIKYNEEEIAYDLSGDEEQSFHLGMNSEDTLECVSWYDGILKVPFNMSDDEDDSGKPCCSSAVPDSPEKKRLINNPLVEVTNVKYCTPVREKVL